MPVGFHIGDRGSECLSVAAKRIVSVVAVERGEILFANALRRPGEGLEVASAESVDKLVEHLFEGVGVACDLEQGDRIGSVAEKYRLVHIQSDADDSSGKCAAAQDILDEYAGDFPVFPIDVVGPFDREARGVAVQHVDNGQRNDLREQELFVGGNMVGS